MARPTSVLGLDIGSHSVKAVEMTMSDDVVAITGMGWERIPDPEMVGDTIHAVLASNNLRAQRVVTSISGRSVIVRYVPMNPMGPQELQEAIRYEADKYIPFDLDEVQLDCQAVGTGTGDQIRVLLVAAKMQLIEEHVGLLSAAGVKPSVLDVDLFAMANAFELCNRMGQLAGEEDSVALVDIGSVKTSIVILRGKDVYFTREVYTAGSSLTDVIARRFGVDPTEVERMKEDPGDALPSMQTAMVETLEELGNEIRLSFDYYENQFDHQVNKLYLSGGSILFPGIAEGLGQLLDVTAERFNPFAYVDVSVYDQTLMQERPGDFMVALGLASRITTL